MKQRLQNKCLRVLLMTAMLGVSAMGAAALFVRYIYVFLASEPAFCAIFSQLRTAQLRGPFWLCVPTAALCIWMLRLYQNGKRLGAVLLGTGCWMLLLLCAVFFMRVNGILFGDVLISLLEVLQKGGLDGL